MNKLNSKNNNAINRRNFLKVGVAGAAIGAISIPAKGREKLVEKVNKNVGPNLIKVHDEFPYEINSTFKRHSSMDLLFSGALFGTHPEDTDILNSGHRFIENNQKHDNSKKGWDQLGAAINAGGWALHHAVSANACFSQAGQGILKWEQLSEAEGKQGSHSSKDWVSDEKYKFRDKQEASNAIKRAARLFGADLIGITKRDKRWDYTDFFDGNLMLQGKRDEAVYGWEKFPFEPKSVIVLAFEEDYECIAAAPTHLGGAAVGEGYTRMTKVAYQLSVMLKQLGYMAVPASNDVGMSVPYAIAAGLGEGSRMGTLVTYKYGPRVRLAKVYTNLDFVEYDKPIEFGVMDFCKNCKRCADACPGKAISFDTEPTFEPPYDNAWYNSTGIKKYYMDARKCIKVWGDFGSDCGSCVAACPYNKPDFWHHRLVDKITKLMPGPVHDFMREMDIAFGYGDVDNPEKVDKFFDASNRSYDGQ
ncbi:reductive dehalogenase [Puteibacter caeruleilacunae]|nr:reductive dehalogenase [Puteibacter caeruleilacunae]